MSTTTQANNLLVTDPGARDERMAVAGFLPVTGVVLGPVMPTDLRLSTTWCHEGHLTLFTIKRAHIELFGRWMEKTGRTPSPVARRLPTANKDSSWGVTRPST